MATVSYLIKLFIVSMIAIILGVVTDTIFDYLSQKYFKNSAILPILELVFGLFVVIITVPYVSKLNEGPSQIITLDALYVSLYFGVLINMGFRIKEYTRKFIDNTFHLNIKPTDVPAE